MFRDCKIDGEEVGTFTKYIYRTTVKRAKERLDALGYGINNFEKTFNNKMFQAIDYSAFLYHLHVDYDEDAQETELRIKKNVTFKKWKNAMRKIINYEVANGNISWHGTVSDVTIRTECDKIIFYSLKDEDNSMIYALNPEIIHRAFIYRLILENCTDDTEVLLDFSNLAFWDDDCIPKALEATENIEKTIVLVEGKTFNLNFAIEADCRDIHDVQPDDFPDVDIIAGGFPCQAFSIAGYRQGFTDEKGRGTLFFELMRLVHVKKPRIVFLENVKNLVGHDKGNTFRVILDTLKKEGYKYRYRVLNAMEYGNTPQNRERIYIAAFRDENDYEKFCFPDPIPLKKKLTDVIDFEHKVDDKYYYTKGKYKGDIYDQLEAAMDDPDTVYQWRRKYVRKNMSGVVPTLTANMGEGGHNVPLVLTHTGIRKLTAHECFNTQGFPLDFKLPSDTAESRLYKQAGNSVCVEVIHRIAENIISAMN